MYKVFDVYEEAVLITEGNRLGKIVDAVCGYMAKEPFCHISAYRVHENGELLPDGNLLSAIVSVWRSYCDAGLIQRKAG